MKWLLLLGAVISAGIVGWYLFLRALPQDEFYWEDDPVEVPYDPHLEFAA